MSCLQQSKKRGARASALLDRTSACLESVHYAATWCVSFPRGAFYARREGSHPKCRGEHTPNVATPPFGSLCSLCAGSSAFNRDTVGAVPTVLLLSVRARTTCRVFTSGAITRYGGNGIGSGNGLLVVTAPFPLPTCPGQGEEGRDHHRRRHQPGHLGGDATRSHDHHPRRGPSGVCC